MKINPDQIPTCPTTLLKLGRYNVTIHSPITLQGRGIDIVNGKSVSPIEGRYCLRLMYNVGGMDCEPADDETRALFPEPEAPVAAAPSLADVIVPDAPAEPCEPVEVAPAFMPSINYEGSMSDLQDDAEDLGIKVDKRWKRKRLIAEIKAATAKD